MASLDLLVLQADGTPKRTPSSGVVLDLTSLRIGTALTPLATDGSGHWTFGSKQLKSVADPTVATDAATKGYVDALITGLDLKASVRLATAAALPAYTAAGAGQGKTLTGNANGALTVDSVAVVLGDRILVKNQAGAAKADHGIYVVTQVGTVGTPYILTRASDADNTPSGEVTAGMFAFVEEGTVNGDQGWILTTNGTITLDTTQLDFSVFSSAGSYVGGNGITIAGLTVTVNHDGQGFTFSGGQLALLLDGSTLSKSGTGLKVAASGITGTELNPSVAGNGLTGGGGSPLDVGAGESVEVGANTVGVKWSASKTNDNASAITIRQIVYVKTNGNVDLALASLANLQDRAIGVVRDTSIAAATSGEIYFKRGSIIPGFSGLTPGARQYVSRTTAGALTESTTGFTTGDKLYSVGRALSSTELIYDPQYILEY